MTEDARLSKSIIMSDQDQNPVRLAEVKQLVDLLQYHDGSIVSRVLLKNKGGTVTLFAFDVGEGLSEHTAPFDALVVVTDGEADIDIAGESFRVQQGGSIILPANRPHAVRAATKFKMMLIMIRA
jgi:quercetin dioxygenase-like cupin family protein